MPDASANLIQRGAARPPPRWSVRTWLLLLALTCLLPGLIGAGILFQHSYENEKVQLQQEALRMSRMLALAVDSELIDALHEGQALAISEYFEQDNLPALHAQAQSLLKATGIGSNVMVSDRQGQQVLNTLVPFGSSLPQHHNLPYLQRQFATGLPAVSDLFYGQLTRRRMASADVPVMFDGQVRYNLAIGVFAERFDAVLNRQQLPDNWIATILDSSGVIVARSLKTPMTGLQAGPLPQRALGSSEGLINFKTTEGIAMQGAYQLATASGWHVVIGIPSAILDKELADGIHLFGLALLALFGLGISLAWFMGNRIARSVNALTAPAIALEAGEAVVVPKVHFREAEDVAVAMAGTARLLAQRKRILQERELELLTAQRLARIGSWNWYFGSDVVDASAETCRMFGLPAIPGFSGQKNTMFAPSVWYIINDALYRVAKNGTMWDLELPARRASGETFWVHYCSEPIRNDKGNIIGLRGTVQDITERRRIQDELDRYRDDLEDQVASRTAELEQARDAAESANRAKSDFLSTMSHELRTPLNAVLGLARLLTGSPLGLRQRDFADKIAASAGALRALIDDVLDFSRIEAGKLQLDTAPFSLNDILRTSATVIGIGIGDKPVEACFDIAPDIPDALIGDALRLQQILLNLISNAVKFTASGTIVVSVRCLAMTTSEVTLQFSVRDTGIGIAADELPMIFEQFGQADSSTTRRYGGSGLGLAISQRLVELMGSTLDVDTAPGQGSEFRFSLTLHLGEPGLPAKTDHLAGLRVLIVDDHPLARTLLARQCAAFGWQATACADGQAGLAEWQRGAAAGTEYDVILLDWQMPGMDGIEVLRQMRALPELSMPSVILLAPAIALEQALSTGDVRDFDRINIKPVIPATLFNGVEQALLGELDCLRREGIQDNTAGTLAGLRLLVAEDNVLNQEVIDTTLRRAGAEVVIVDNGLCAVAALREGHAGFDAVLMDIRMPVLDGREATRVIRTELGLATLPVIALTAFADASERASFQQAGMSGYLAKPLDIDALLDLLGTLPGARDPARRPSPGRPDTEPDVDALDVPAGLQAFGSDASKFSAILREFVDSHGDDAAQAHRLYAAGDSNAAIDMAHGLAGMARLLRTPALAIAASAAETALRHGDSATITPLLEALVATMPALIDAINRFDGRHIKSAQAQSVILASLFFPTNSPC